MAVQFSKLLALRDGEKQKLIPSSVIHKWKLSLYHQCMILFCAAIFEGKNDSLCMIFFSKNVVHSKSHPQRRFQKILYFTNVTENISEITFLPLTEIINSLR